MNFETKLQELNPLRECSNALISEYAQACMNYGHAFKAGKLSADEYQSLIGDVDTLKHMANSADEEGQVQKINDIARALLSLM